MESHVFGPVPSRRLGRSLGVDLVPFKTCSYDCIYCQLGRTTHKTLERKEWVPLEEILDQVKASLGARPDYITLSGLGEPTLYSRLAELIAGIKRITEVPVAVLTNGSLLGDPEVRAGIAEADLVVPSLDAGDAGTFSYVNRPHKEIDFDAMVEGLVALGREHPGSIWLEVFLLAGVTAISAEVEKIASIVRRVDPERVQLNTATRPPAESFAYPVPQDQMERFAAAFGNHAETIADYRGTHQQGEFEAHREDVLDLLRRRPCTVGDIAEGLGLHRNEVVKYVEELTAGGKLTTDNSNGRIYYKALPGVRLTGKC
jgi:wyosine [tRNA(Phe)-imidazoG37] synthetase (radical SAM superfamily)